MASVVIPLCSDCQQSALAAGLSCNVSNSTTLTVYSDSIVALRTWVITNQIKQTVTPYEMTPRLCQCIHDINDIHDTHDTHDILSSHSANVPYFNMTQLRSIYQIPSPSDAAYVVGVVSFGGGLYGTVDSQGVLTNGDVQAYWTSIGIAPANQPKVIVVGINGATNRPNSNDNGATMENTLDVETIGGACPSANLTIILYIAPNSFNQFAPLFNYMYSTNVTVNGVNYKPNLISCSWGAPEIYYSSSQLSSINSILETITNAGITICAATGDYGSNNGVGGTGNYVDFPSSNPYITAVGGTTLFCPNNVYDGLTVETAWSSGGGGISAIYSKPAYQSRLSGTMRMTPDIASLSDPSTGVIFIVNGQLTVIGGTSVAAPTIAGFLAAIRYTQFVNPLLYQAPYSTCFHDIVRGSNGSYFANIVYDNCTGLGSINGQALSSYILDPPILVSGIVLNSNNITLTSTQTVQLSATITPANASNQEIVWSSSNLAVATVSNGFITAIATGSANITVSSTDGSNIFAVVLVTVTAVPVIPVSNITLNQTSAALRPTNTLTLTATVMPSNATDKTVTWSSSSTNATVNSSGVVTAVSAGSAVIRATTVSGNLVATCTLTITVYVSSVTITPTTFTLHTGSTRQLTATIVPSNATNKAVTWSSANTSVATVNSLGVVTGISAGSTTIRAQTVNGGFISTSAVTVTIGVQKITQITSNLSLVKGATFQSTATIMPSDATNKTVTWSSAIASIATVSNSGLITAVGNGTGIISCFTQDGNKTSSIIVRVTTPVSSVRLNQTAITLSRNATYQLLSIISPSTASNRAVTWSSSNSAIATVSSSGNVRGVAIGSAVITDQTSDGSFRAACNITVRA
jgi:uncharacterized protein YjdB